MCYVVKEPGKSVRVANVNHQFGPLSLIVTKERELCVSSQKALPG